MFLPFSVDGNVGDLVFGKDGLIDQDGAVRVHLDIFAAESSFVILKLAEFISLLDLIHFGVVVLISSMNHVVGGKSNDTVKFSVSIAIGEKEKYTWISLALSISEVFDQDPPDMVEPCVGIISETITGLQQPKQLSWDQAWNSFSWLFRKKKTLDGIT